MSRIPRLALLLVLVATSAFAQEGGTQSGAGFTVASVKPALGGMDSMRKSWTPGRYTARSVPLILLIGEAYGEGPDFRGGPDWVRRTSVLWDVEATFAPPEADVDRKRAMLQALLAERFQLAMGRTVEDTDVYLLQFASGDRRLGASIQPSVVPCDSPERAKRPLVNRMVFSFPPYPPCNNGMVPGYDLLPLGNSPLRDLTTLLQLLLEKPIVDRTGLDGLFDIVLQFDFSPYPRFSRGAAAAEPSTAPSLFTAVKEQLGLTLQSVRLPREYRVIERVERPTPN